MGVQKHHKKRLTKNRVERLLQKSTKQNKTVFFLGFVLSRFWAFFGEASSKTRIKGIRGNKSDPGPFLASDPPTHHGGRLKFFADPLGLSPSPVPPARAVISIQCMHFNE
jgi:hypothetical protein